MSGHFINLTEIMPLGIRDNSQFKAILKNDDIAAGDSLKFTIECHLGLYPATCIRVQKINIEAEYDARDNFIFCGIDIDKKTLKKPAREKLAKECGYDSLEDLAWIVWHRLGGTKNAFLIEWGFPFDKLEIGGYYQDANGNRVEIAEVDPVEQTLWAWLIDDEEVPKATQRFTWAGKVLPPSDPKLSNLTLQVAP